jgi:hypothetical protein
MVDDDDTFRGLGHFGQDVAGHQHRASLAGSTRPSSMRSVVVLPAPFGPRNPVIVPRLTEKLSRSTAVTCPKRLVSPRVSIAGTGA